MIPERIATVLGMFGQIMSQVVAEHQRAQERLFAPMREAMKWLQLLHRAAEVVHEPVIEGLLSRGWCHSYHFTDAAIIHLAEAFKREAYVEIDEGMAAFTRQQLDRIRSVSCNRFPKRAAILDDAFAAHAEKRYALSIPTFLAQLDGIGGELLGLSRNKFLNHESRKDALTKKVESFVMPGSTDVYPLGSLHDRMISPLKLPWGFTIDTDRRSTDGTMLNRHGVLHGLDVDYPTEMNSLRCILWIGYLQEVHDVLNVDTPRFLQELREMHDGVFGNSARRADRE